MNLLKKSKFNIMMFGLFLMLFGLSYASESYDNLVGFVKEANFVEFKKQFEKGLITSEQKQELLKLANEVIDKEYKYWHSYRSDVPEALAGKTLKDVIKAGCFLSSVFGFITPIALGFVIRNYFKGKNEFEQKYQNLPQNYSRRVNVSLLHGVQNIATIASSAQMIEQEERFWFKDIIAQVFASCSPLLLSVLILFANKFNKKVLQSYKRWKRANKIKKLIELN